MFGSGFSPGMPDFSRAVLPPQISFGDPFMSSLSNFLGNGGLQYIEAGYNYPGFSPYACAPRFCNSLFSPAYANMGPSDALLGLSIGMTAVMGGLAIANMFGAFDGIFGESQQAAYDPYGEYQSPFGAAQDADTRSAGLGGRRRDAPRGGDVGASSGAEDVRRIAELRREDEARTRDRAGSDTPAVPATTAPAVPAATTMNERQWRRDASVRSFAGLLNGDRRLGSSGNGFARVVPARGKKLVLGPKRQKRGESDADYRARWTGEMREFFGRTLTGGKTGEAVFMERLEALPDETTLILGPDGAHQKTAQELKSMTFAEIFKLLTGEDWTRSPVIPLIPGPEAEEPSAERPVAVPPADVPAIVAVDPHEGSFLGRLDRSGQLSIGGMRFRPTDEIAPNIDGARSHTFIVLPDSTTYEDIETQLARCTSPGAKEDFWVAVDVEEGDRRYKVIFECGERERAGEVYPNGRFIKALVAKHLSGDIKLHDIYYYHQHPLPGGYANPAVPATFAPVSIADMNSSIRALRDFPERARLAGTDLFNGEHIQFRVVTPLGVYSINPKDGRTANPQEFRNGKKIQYPHSEYARKIGEAFGVSCTFRHHDESLSIIQQHYFEYVDLFDQINPRVKKMVEVAAGRPFDELTFPETAAARAIAHSSLPLMERAKGAMDVLVLQINSLLRRVGPNAPYRLTLEKMLADVNKNMRTIEGNISEFRRIVGSTPLA